MFRSGLKASSRILGRPHDSSRSRSGDLSRRCLGGGERDRFRYWSSYLSRDRDLLLNRAAPLRTGLWRCCSGDRLRSTIRRRGDLLRLLRLPTTPLPNGLHGRRSSGLLCLAYSGVLERLRFRKIGEPPLAKFLLSGDCLMSRPRSGEPSLGQFRRGGDPSRFQFRRSGEIRRGGGDPLPHGPLWSGEGRRRTGDLFGLRLRLRSSTGSS